MERAQAAAVVTSSALADLADKYARILALREAHTHAKATGTEEPPPRAEMARLAARWPGALRELDELPIAEVHARIAELAAARGDTSRVKPWMAAQILFHAEARAVLAAKRWLGRTRAVDDDVRARFRAASLGDDVHAWSSRLDEIARPPRGRLLDLVWPEVARGLGCSVDEARALVLSVTAGR